MTTFKDQAKSEKTEISEEDLKKAVERTGVARAKLLLQQPFYGVLLSMVDLIPETSVPTMATDGNKIYYHPEFVKGLTNDEIYGVLLHEISHCIYNHCGNKRRMNRSVHRFNVACDFAVNLEIKDMGYSLPPNLLLDNKYREMNAEQIYDLLPEDCDNFTTLDIHIDNGDEGSWDDMEEKILTAWEATKDSTSRGATPAGIKRWIDKIRKSRVKWERIFHRYVGQALAKDDYSFTRVNKRFLGQGLYLPDLRSYSIGNVIIAVDTSGSISKEQIECFAAEIKKLSSLIESITVITCDAEVHEVVKLNKFEDFTKKLYFKGGGGTSHKPVFNKIKELNLNPELFIGLTDLYSDINDIKKPLYPVIWVSTSEISTAHFGHVVQLPRGKNDW